ncbi:MAG: NAD-dependent epimerase/dehydratase family protein, partial [Promethearchaeota archaeon]
MSAKNILVTGGAGFIGSHLVIQLLAKGHDVSVFDNLDPQVHGQNAQIPAYLPPEAKFIRGDVTNTQELSHVLQDQDPEIIFHLAAKVGVAQSMYQIAEYISVNTGGTAALLDILANYKHDVKKLVVASSMSVYGEGAYKCEDHGIVFPSYRNYMDQTPAKIIDWELHCPICGLPTHPIPTPETKPLNPSTIYSLTKRHQEEMCLMVGDAYGIPTTALRFFGTYGSHQALSNPYT